MKRNICDWIKKFCKKVCDLINFFPSHSFRESIYRNSNRLGIDLGIDFSLIINKVTDGTDFFHFTTHPYFFSIFFSQRKVRNGEKTIKSIPNKLQLNPGKALRWESIFKQLKPESEKTDLVRECRATGIRFTNESLRQAARILHTLKFISNT